LRISRSPTASIRAGSRRRSGAGPWHRRRPLCVGQGAHRRPGAGAGEGLGRRGRRIDRQQLRWLLEVYSRGGVPGMKLAHVAARLGVTQGRISHLLADRTIRPLPRRLVLRCERRGRHLQGGWARSVRALSADQVVDARRRHGGGETLASIAVDLEPPKGSSAAPSEG
jgi:hypothetical protein